MTSPWWVQFIGIRVKHAPRCIISPAPTAHHSEIIDFLPHRFVYELRPHMFYYDSCFGKYILLGKLGQLFVRCAYTVGDQYAERICSRRQSSWGKSFQIIEYYMLYMILLIGSDFEINWKSVCCSSLIIYFNEHRVVTTFYYIINMSAFGIK